LSIYFAIKPPPDVASVLAATAREVTRELGGKPAREDTIHLTLAFLGELPAQHFGELIDVARGVRAESFDVPIDRLGYWAHNRLLWAGSQSFPPALMSLAAQLEAVLLDAGYLKIDVSGRHPFTPHITLARKVNGPVDAARLQMSEALAWSCRGFVLIRSQRSDTVPSHEILEEFSLDTIA